MSIIIAKSVNFGSGKTGLSTVGYTLKNPDGTEKQARTTSGIVEVVSGQGMYGGNITFEIGWSGFLIWDTGDAEPYYADENFDYRSYQGAGGGVGLYAGPTKKEATVWKASDKKRILKNLKKIMEDMKVSADKVDGFSEVMRNIREKDLKILLDRKNESLEIREALTNLLESVSKLSGNDINFSRVVETLQKLQILIESQNNFFEPIIDGLSVLVESESIKSIEKEISR